MSNNTTVRVHMGYFIIECPAWDNQRAKDLPDRKWEPEARFWSAPINPPNAQYILKEYSKSELSNSVQSSIDDMYASVKSKGKVPFPSWYTFKGTPMSQQLAALNKAWGMDEFALFMEMRTGKTFTAINLATAYRIDDQIKQVVVVCPTPVKFVWEIENESFCPIPYDTFVIESGRYNKTQAQKFIANDSSFKILIVGIEALSQGNAIDMVLKFIDKQETMAIVDESSRIKNAQSKRTERAWDIGGLCEKRLILTGTPVTQGIEDLFAQFRFLNWQIIGKKSFYAYRNRYCIMGGFEGRAIIGYRNMKELLDLIEPYCYVVEAKDCFDLPEKIYEQRIVEPTPNQKKAFAELHDVMYTESGDDELEVATVLERMVRYQQIAGGSFPFKDEEGYQTKPIPGANPKLDELMAILPEIQGKIIIWARFRPELEAIIDRLAADFGADSFVEFYGATPPNERKDNVQRFQNDPECRFFVSNQQTGGMGIELSAASAHIFYSCSFSYEDRVQSEARTNSKKQTAKSILYVDITINHDIDKKIAAALHKKQSVAQYVTKEIKG